MVARLQIKPVDPQQHETANDKRGAHYPHIEQVSLDGAVGERTDHHGGQKGNEHPENEAPRVCAGEHAKEQVPQSHSVDRQQRKDCAELDQDRKGLSEFLVLKAEEMTHEQEMASRRNGNELGQTLDHAEDCRRNKFLQGHGSNSAAEEGAAAPVREELAG